ncbi:hypothetical protein CLW00_101286 [Mongoliibacter ruber]|uniref:Uncharacterized protein n=1 Tax=Mongoliibacter ruber TaxID=1750599 RepID=A0A2T0WVA1_9BACT|nr:hypothetical protein CLW00_101286 [Mongoliibacter ruber]
MNATIRAQHLGFAVPTETAREFTLKFIVSFLMICLISAVMISQEIRPDLWKTEKPSKALRSKVRRARKKTFDLFTL